ncbi:TPA: DUF1642 domain-containing protein [Streptococcus suis]
MNKQEAIKYFKAKKDKYIVPPSDIQVSIAEVIDVISQIHEPPKVVIPKFVAEWLEWCKENSLTLSEALSAKENKSDDLQTAVNEWFTSNHEDLFARAWLDGFEIEQEKLYEVTVPGTSNYKNQRQHLVKQGKNWFFCGNDVNRFKYRFTKGQIEAAGFGWVFDCDGVKVVEVE